mmetsp:Transcript_3340/g.11582  ORF Transcript_3340/g.11582 Transcript_3340/m.11582 type:complete len:273 (-) Transcript_3340:1736-2554(-)
MAWHMWRLRMRPEAPMRAPMVVRSGLLSTKPSAHRAQPLYELRTVMTTGVSADPMASVMSAPSTAAIPPVAASAVRPVASGAPAAMNGTAAATEAAKSARLTRFFPGSATDLDDTKPWSLPNATMEPVNVTAPMKVPAQMASLWPMSAAAGCAAKLATEVTAAARPTREWKAATSWGRSVMATLAATPRPATAPTASTPAMSRTAFAVIPGAMGASVAATPSATPAAPSALPVRAVSWEERPQMAPMQHSALARPTIMCMPAVAAPAAVAQP